MRFTYLLICLVGVAWKVNAQKPKKNCIKFRDMNVFNIDKNNQFDVGLALATNNPDTLKASDDKFVWAALIACEKFKKPVIKAEWYSSKDSTKSYCKVFVEIGTWLKKDVPKRYRKKVKDSAGFANGISVYKFAKINATSGKIIETGETIGNAIIDF